MAILAECFFVTPIGSTGSKERSRADKVLKYVLRPAIGDSFKIVRADEVDTPGTITTDIIKRLHESPLVVADLTGQNPNVMYEIGLRHVFNLPIVQLAQKDEQLPFDISGERTIFFDIEDLESVDEVKKRIKSACKAAQSEKPFRSSVVKALQRDSFLFSLQDQSYANDLFERLEKLGEKIDRSMSDFYSSAYDIASNTAAEIHLNNEMSESDSDRLNEVLRIFDRVGPYEMSLLAEAAKILVSKQSAK